MDIDNTMDIDKSMDIGKCLCSSTFRTGKLLKRIGGQLFSGSSGCLFYKPVQKQMGSILVKKEM